MGEYKRYNSKREVIKMDLVSAADYTDNVIVCVPKFSYDVARSLLGWYGKWRTTYATEYQELFYKVPNDAEFDAIEASIDLFLGSRDMTCDIREGLDCICSGIQELVAASYANNVDGLNTVNGYNLGGTPYIGNEVALGETDIDTVLYPAGASDAAYIAAKCVVANTIIQGLIATLNNMSLFSLASLIAGSVALSAITVFSGGVLTLPTIGLVAGALGVLALTETSFAQLATYIDDNRADLVCALFDSTTSLEAYDAVRGIIRAISWSGVNENVTEQLVMSIIPVDVLNSLWTTFGLPPLDIETTVDCANCGQCLSESGTCTLGTWDGGDRFTTELRTEFNPDRHTVVMVFDCVVDILDVTLISGTPQTATNAGYRFFDELSQVIYSSNTIPPSGLAGVKWFDIQDSYGSVEQCVVDITWELA